MARCNPANNRTQHLRGPFPARGGALLALALALFSGTAVALKSDNDQPMDVDAGTSRIEADKQVSAKKTIFLHGDVMMKQGTIRAHGDDATIYMDKDDPATIAAAATAGGKATDSSKSKTKRLILTGKLAHMEQMQDNDGGLMTADAERLDYKVDVHLVEMTGNVTVVQQKQGTFHSEHMTYNTLTGEMVGGGEDPASHVHIVLQPKDEKADKPAPPPKPAPAAPSTTPAKKNKNKDTTHSPPGTVPPPPPANPDGH